MCSQAASSDPKALRETVALIAHRRSSGHSRADFYPTTWEACRSGVGQHLTVNLEQFSLQTVNNKQAAGVPEGVGLANVRYLFAISKERRRAESWLGPCADSLLVLASAMLRMPTAETSNRLERLGTDGCLAGE